MVVDFRVKELCWIPLIFNLVNSKESHLTKESLECDWSIKEARNLSAAFNFLVSYPITGQGSKYLSQPGETFCLSRVIPHG